MTKQFVIQDFSGGITDYHLDAETNRCAEAENLVLYRHGRQGKLETRPGSTLTYSAAPQPSGASERVDSFFYLEDTLFCQVGDRLYYDNGSGWTELQGSTGNSLFLVDMERTTAHDYWNGHLFITSATDPAGGGIEKGVKVCKDSLGAWKMYSVGLPDPDGMAAVTSSPNPLVASYRYAAVLTRTYTVGDRTFKDVSSVDYDEVVLQQEALYTGMAYPTQLVGTSYSTPRHPGTIVREYYRTTDNGAIFYKIGENLSSDDMPDSTLVNQEQLYTTGGVVDNDSPPLTRYFHVAEDRGYWAHREETFTNRIWQSQAGDPDSVPATFFVDVDEPIRGISSVQGRVIAICDNSVFRIDGSFDELGQGFMAAQKIDSRASCVSHNSIVQTMDGIFWAGREGIYFSDGFKVIRVNDGWDQRYTNLISGTEAENERIYGAYDRKKKRIWWSCRNDIAASDHDRCYILDLNFGISPDMPCTSAVDNGNLSFQPTALLFQNGNMYRGDPRGYVFTHNEDTLSDPLVDTGVTPANWAVEPILFNYTSAATSFGQIGTRKMVQRTGLVCDSAKSTALSLKLTTITDDGRKFGEAKPIKFIGGLIWGGVGAIWGLDYRWGNDGISDIWRRVPAKARRCNFSQTKLTNAEVALYNSDSLGTATIDDVAKTATLAAGTWPSDIVGYSIAFSSDSYVTEHEITAVSSGVATYSGLPATEGSGIGWVIRGVLKEQAVRLLSVTQHYDVFGRTQESYSSAASATGENA